MVGGAVDCREFVVLQGEGVGVRQVREFILRERETSDQQREPSHQLAMFGLIGQIRLIRPIENRPYVPLKDRALRRVGYLALGMGAKKLVSQI